MLDAAPSDDVVVSVASSDTSEGTVGVSTLTFTSANWYLPQAVTVNGVDDAEADGDIAYTIVLATASSGDAAYDGIDPADVVVTNLDNESGGRGQGGGNGGGKPKKLLADGQPGPNVASLDNETALATVMEALSLWTQTLGTSWSHPIEVVVADLPVGQLGEAYGSTVTLDINGNGMGWSVNGAYAHYDLLTVAAHEVGHVMGLDHSHDETGLMASHLPVGIRRLPSLFPL